MKIVVSILFLCFLRLSELSVASDSGPDVDSKNGLMHVITYTVPIFESSIKIVQDKSNRLITVSKEYNEEAFEPEMRLEMQALAFAENIINNSLFENCCKIGPAYEILSKHYPKYGEIQDLELNADMDRHQIIEAIQKVVGYIPTIQISDEWTYYGCKKENSD